MDPLSEAEQAGVVIPAELVEKATAENASEIYYFLKELTLDEKMTDNMREDIRARMSELPRNFPESF